MNNVFEKIKKIKFVHHKAIQKIEEWNGFLRTCELSGLLRSKMQAFLDGKGPLVVAVFIAIASIAAYLIINKDNIEAAGYAWQQTDWSGGQDNSNFPSQQNNQTGWTKYYSAGTGSIDVSNNELKLNRYSN